jgi:hypothetical protein
MSGREVEEKRGMLVKYRLRCDRRVNNRKKKINIVNKLGGVIKINHKNILIKTLPPDLPPQQRKNPFPLSPPLHASPLNLHSPHAFPIT